MKNDVTLGKNDVIRENNVIFNIDNRVHRLANEFPKVFLLINRFKSDFKVQTVKIANFAENRQNEVILCRLLGQNDAIRQNYVIFWTNFSVKDTQYPFLTTYQILYRYRLLFLSNSNFHFTLGYPFFSMNERILSI